MTGSASALPGGRLAAFAPGCTGDKLLSTALEIPTISTGRTAAAALLLLLVASYSTATHAGPYEDGDAAFRSRNYAAALKLWQPLAESGHAEAQLGVATLYYSGLGVVLAADILGEGALP